MAGIRMTVPSMPTTAGALNVLLPVALLFMSLPSVWRDGHAVTLTLPLTVALIAPLLAKNRHPRLVFAAISIVALVQWDTGARLFADVALLAAFYAVAARESVRVTLAAAAVLEAGSALAVYRWAGEHSWFMTFVLLSGTVTAAGVLGAYTRTRRAYLRELQERADRLELERDQQGQLAAAAERARIAREMHDIVAHHLTVMIALSDGAAAAVDSAPQRASAAMTSVSATGRQALSETRALLGVLRSDTGEADRAPQPDLGQLDVLLAQVRTAGLPVTYTVEGSGTALPGGVQLTLYRLVQEALTNTLKHAGPGARAEVRLLQGPTEVRLDVTDDGLGAVLAPSPHPQSPDPQSPDPQSPDGGHGLAGMRERVEAWGGELDSGPRAAGGWRVSARLRTAPAPAPVPVPVPQSVRS